MENKTHIDLRTKEKCFSCIIETRVTYCQSL